MTQSILLSVLAATTLFCGINSLPSAEVYPEVIPGPSLPSLSTIGLTSEQLYTMKPQLLVNTKLELAPAIGCETWSTANVDDVIACFNYLVSIGNNRCEVGDRDNVFFCRTGTAEITGSYRHGSTSCWDVALAVQWIFTNCNNGGQVGGSKEVANLVVGVQNINWGLKSGRVGLSVSA